MLVTRRLLAAGLLLAAVCVGTVTAARALRDERQVVHDVTTAKRVDGRIALFRDSRDEFVSFVERIVPPHAAVRILQPRRTPPPGARPAPGPPGVCGNEVNSGAYWLLVYSLSPRTSVCDAAGSWTIYFGVPLPPDPDVRRFSATLGIAPP